MRVCCVSDLHVDVGSQPHIVWPDADVLIVAGDTANELGPLEKTFRKLHKQGKYKKIFHVDGNHEHYSNRGSERTVEQTLKRIDSLTFPYATFLPKWNFVEHDGFYFVGRNGWYSCDYSGEPSLNRAMWPHVMNDAHWGGFEKEAYMPWHLAEQHAWQMEKAILEILEQDQHARIVAVTHTSPVGETLSRYPEHIETNCYYYNSTMNKVLERFSQNLVLWHHGHTHYRQMKTVSGVPVVVNPRGYPGENRRWEPVVVEI